MAETRRLGRLVFLAGLVVLHLALAPARALAEPGVHVVQAGDTLYDLARRYRTTIEAIAQANGLSSASLIFKGQPLIIPELPAGPVAAQPAPGPGLEPAYVVEAGDTLVGIALRYGLPVWDLARLNGLQRWDLIFAGQRLKLPVAATGGDGQPIPGGRKRIEVDVSEQRMRVYEDDRLIWDWPASTGVPSYPTRYGRFQVLDKIPLAYSRPWDLWMPHWLGIYWAGGSENGIHSLPIINGQTLWAGYLGSRISYGCVVIGTEEGETLFSWAEIGTTVEVHE